MLLLTGTLCDRVLGDLEIFKLIFDKLFSNSVDPASDVDDKADTDVDVELCNDLELPPTPLDHRTKVRRQSLNRPRPSPSPDEETAASPEPVSTIFKISSRI